jgi:hypothetical protein
VIHLVYITKIIAEKYSLSRQITDFKNIICQRILSIFLAWSFAMTYFLW